MREILFRGKRIDNGDKLDGTHLTLKEKITEKRCVFVCDCGNVTTQLLSNIENGRVKSCGCDRYRKLSERNSKHNGHGTRLYRIWRGLFKRCYNKNATDYANYGGRGIEVCSEWKDFAEFRRWSEANGYAEHLTIDRLNENGNYEPNNCRWATMKEQQEHKRARSTMPLRDKKTGRFVKNA